MMNRFFAFFPALLLLGGGIVLVEGPNVDVDWGTFSVPWFGNDDGDPDTPDDVDTEPGVDDEGDPPEGEVDVVDCRPHDVVGEYLAESGFDYPGDYTKGVGSIDWSLLSRDHVEHSFTSTLKTEAAVQEFLDGDSVEGREARRLAGSDVDDWVPVQFQNLVEYTGNWNWDGHTAERGGDLMVYAGDVWWFGVDTDDCSLDQDSSVRAACGNVGFDWIRPYVKND